MFSWVLVLQAQVPKHPGSPGPTKGTLIYSKSLICKWEYGGPTRRDDLWKPHRWSSHGGRAESSFLILAPLWGRTEVLFWYQHWPNLLWAWASAFESRITKHPILCLFLSLILIYDLKSVTTKLFSNKM